ncbi:hypothetical protein IQ278_18395 [Tolypothrix sp. LEGE 11397]|nr:hypothetical protein FDUTEX481_06588 [Tolypothrix sp. PCC 7601]MBE9084077.1 hypothetical protein [Tolypothrix sp. LEGE 11397]UYD31029.1 hypothetical protein HGR01_39830 [Tolypothrix sp. PCC 7712]UYD38894.1 hypothetical protein HG267_40975 [Tolypothrix sp. PCC 7601]BAY95967.1 hypothetical protein NIES3275_80440 [Microchaete diplosiphon NIES-3275]
MIDLQLVGCVTLLTQSKTYSIDGILYRYLYSNGTIKHTQYMFRPLPRQRKTADLQLNRDKVLRKVYEIPLLYNQHHATQTATAIQQSLF